MYILDTNIVDILFFMSPARERVVRSIEEAGKDNVCISTITVYEKFFTGLLPELKKSFNTEAEVAHFEMVTKMWELMAKFRIVSFTAEDYKTFQEIYGEVNKAAMDCRIAASAKTRDWTVVTHDGKDFHRIKEKCGVKVEDWSIIPPS